MDWEVPLFDLELTESERAAVLAVIDSGWLTAGPKTAEFEEAFAAKVGSTHAIAVSSGTAALHLSCLVAGLGRGDEAVVPSLSFVATANAVLYTGARPVFADTAGNNDLTISARDIARRITGRTKAIIVMHYGGYPCDMESVQALADRHGLVLIEDAAHVPGGSLGGRMLGTFGHFGAFSFFSNKNITTGEGGMIVTDDDEAAGLLRRLRSHGMTQATWDRHRGHAFSYDVLDLGFNYRTSEMAAALGLAQLARLEEFNSARERLTRRYREALARLDGIEACFLTPRGTPAYHIMPAMLDEGISRETFMSKMREASVQTSIHYPPIHEFSYYRSALGQTTGLPVTEDVGAREVTLPLFPSMTDSQFTKVVETIARVLDAGRASREERGA